MIHPPTPRLANEKASTYVHRLCAVFVSSRRVSSDPWRWSGPVEALTSFPSPHPATHVPANTHHDL